MIYRNESYAVSRPMGIGFTGPYNGRDWCDGDVVTPTHLIRCYSQEGHTRFDCVHRGRHFIRTTNRRMTQRAMVREAAKWSRELAKRGRAGR